MSAEMNSATPIEPGKSAAACIKLKVAEGIPKDTGHGMRG
jgi:hypothetical protein